MLRLQGGLRLRDGHRCSKEFEHHRFCLAEAKYAYGGILKVRQYHAELSARKRAGLAFSSGASELCQPGVARGHGYSSAGDALPGARPQGVAGPGVLDVPLSGGCFVRLLCHFGVRELFGNCSRKLAQTRRVHNFKQAQTDRSVELET